MEQRVLAFQHSAFGIPTNTVKHVFADYAGAARVPVLLHDKVCRSLRDEGAVSNPHTETDGVAAHEMAWLRRHTLQHECHVDERTHLCVLTGGATDGMRRVAMWFPFDSRTLVLWTVNNHNSALGIRECARRQGASLAYYDGANVHAVMPDGEVQWANIDMVFCIGPSHCNLTGELVAVDWHALLRPFLHKNAEVYVMLDAAKSFATHVIPNIDFDILTLSYYKRLGWPCGVGALVLSRRVAHLLARNKTYFGGGAVDASSAYSLYVVPRGTSDPVRVGSCADRFATGSRAPMRLTTDWFEDGSLPFLSIIETARMLRLWTSVLSQEDLSNYVESLARQLSQRLRELRGCTVYTDTGGIVTFNLFVDDKPISNVRVARVAAALGVTLRASCACNPGACARLLGNDDQLLRKVKHMCGSEGVFEGRHIGVLRASFGAGSRKEDVDVIVTLIKEVFCRKSSVASTYGGGVEHEAHIERLCLYPIKGCRAQEVTEWPLGKAGLLYDRSFALIDVASGRLLTLKNCSALTRVSATIDIVQHRLTLRDTVQDSVCSTSLDALEVPVADSDSDSAAVVLDSVSLNQKLDDWISRALGRQVRLVSCDENASLSNSAPLLVLRTEYV
ncbi:MAG: hypothetical protein MHM6MM_004382 [Cercozoa sp. M6MM]